MGLDRGGLDVFLCLLQNFYRGGGGPIYSRRKPATPKLPLTASLPVNREDASRSIKIAKLFKGAVFMLSMRLRNHQLPVLRTRTPF